MSVQEDKGMTFKKKRNENVWIGSDNKTTIRYDAFSIPNLPYVLNRGTYFKFCETLEEAKAFGQKHIACWH